VQSESELVGVMRVLVDLWQKEKATTKGKEVDSRTAEKESRRAAKDRDNLLRRASDKARSDDEVSGLGSGGGSSDYEDQTSCEDAPARVVNNQPPDWIDCKVSLCSTNQSEVSQNSWQPISSEADWLVGWWGDSGVDTWYGSKKGVFIHICRTILGPQS
jgi:hypothetical protein